MDSARDSIWVRALLSIIFFRHRSEPPGMWRPTASREARVLSVRYRTIPQTKNKNIVLRDTAWWLITAWWGADSGSVSFSSCRPPDVTGAPLSAISGAFDARAHESQPVGLLCGSNFAPHVHFLMIAPTDAKTWS